MALVGKEAGGRPLKVAIAGGGVGGLTTAFYMLKSGMDVTVRAAAEGASSTVVHPLLSQPLSRNHARFHDPAADLGARRMPLRDGFASLSHFRFL